MKILEEKVENYFKEIEKENNFLSKKYDEMIKN